jgi:predicted nucleic acid-binding protein
LLVSAIEVYEVYKVIRRDIRRHARWPQWRRCAAPPSRRSTNRSRSRPPDISLVHGLAMANSVVYATARRHGAKLVTTDADFEELPEAVVIR